LRSFQVDIDSVLSLAGEVLGELRGRYPSTLVSCMHSGVVTGARELFVLARSVGARVSRRSGCEILSSWDREVVAGVLLLASARACKFQLTESEVAEVIAARIGGDPSYFLEAMRMKAIDLELLKLLASRRAQSEDFIQLIVERLKLESRLGKDVWRRIRMGAREVTQRALDKIRLYRRRKEVVAASAVYLSALWTAGIYITQKRLAQIICSTEPSIRKCSRELREAYIDYVCATEKNPLCEFTLIKSHTLEPCNLTHRCSRKS